jgi:hypothetical protein
MSELHVTAGRGRHDGSVEVQRAKYATQRATFFPRGLRHLHGKRRGKGDDVAVVRQPNPAKARPPLMLLHLRTRSHRASSALEFYNPRWIKHHFFVKTH